MEEKKQTSSQTELNTSENTSHQIAVAKPKKTISIKFLILLIIIIFVLSGSGWYFLKFVRPCSDCHTLPIQSLTPTQETPPPTINPPSGWLFYTVKPVQTFLYGYTVKYPPTWKYNNAAQIVMFSPEIKHNEIMQALSENFSNDIITIEITKDGTWGIHSYGHNVFDVYSDNPDSNVNFQNIQVNNYSGVRAFRTNKDWNNYQEVIELKQSDISEGFYYAKIELDAPLKNLQADQDVFNKLLSTFNFIQ